VESLIRRIVEWMGAHRDAPEHRLLSELDVATELGVEAADVEIALGRMASEGLLERGTVEGRTALRLSEKGLAAYRNFMAAR
jgi:DNA-binding transcriptional regulator PaaX